MYVLIIVCAFDATQLFSSCRFAPIYNKTFCKEYWHILYAQLLLFFFFGCDMVCSVLILPKGILERYKKSRTARWQNGTQRSLGEKTTAQTCNLWHFTSSTDNSREWLRKAALTTSCGFYGFCKMWQSFSAFPWHISWFCHSFHSRAYTEKMKKRKAIITKFPKRDEFVKIGAVDMCQAWHSPEYHLTIFRE